MSKRLSPTALLVDDYDDAIAVYVGALGFELREDTVIAEAKCSVVVAPPGAAAGLLLARVVDGRQRRAIDYQAGGRVFLFLEPTTSPMTKRTMSIVVFASTNRRDKSLMALCRCSRIPPATAGI